jgi:hypothetical protein
VRDAILRRRNHLYQTLTTLSGWNADIVVTPPTWRVRFVRWLLAVTVLSIAYQAYALLVVPWIEPGPGAEVQPAPFELPPTGDTHPELAELFPEGAWERGRPMVLTTQWGKLLFREYRPSDDGRLELAPCTIVFYAPTRGKQGTDSRRAVVLQAPDKAVLSFSGPLNLARAEFTKLKGARLEGEVKIWSRETTPGANDALSIVTRNVQILPQQIWTANDVTFQYGASRGSGRDLSITLSQTGDDGTASSKDALVKNLESLELAHVEKLVLQVPAHGLLGDTLPAAAPAAQPSDISTPSRPSSTDVNVTCRGSFRFDFQQSVASLDDHVDVVRDNADGQSDQLNCDRLLIYFESSSTTAPADQATPTTPTDGHSVVQKLAVRRIEAHGFPATLHVPSMAAMARGQQLSYDFQTRRILLVDEQNASLVYREHQAEAPRLEYELHAEPRRLGHLWATGPGIYQGQFGDGPDQRLTARWRGVLELQPQEGLHVLSIIEGADITSNGLGNFAADELYVWLAEVPVPEPTVNPLPPQDSPMPVTASEVELAPAQPEAVTRPSAPSAAPAPPARLEIRPVKMLAQGNVHADSRQFQGQTPRLEIWFDQLDDVSQKAGEASHVDPTPPAAVPAPVPPGLPSTKNDDKKLELTGDWIRLRLRMTPARPKVHEATVVGNVRLSQLSSVPGDLSLLITGEMLQLRTDPLDRSAVDVNGTPARVHAQGMLLEGSNLHLSQRENRLWAEGPGRMKLPTREKTAAPGTLPAAPPTTPSAPNTPIWINWQGGMDFDGQLVRFVQQVEVRGIHSVQNGDRLHVLAIGDQLHAMVNRYVAFEQTKSSDDLDVVELRFLGDVFTENQTFNAQDVITSRDRMKTRDMTLDRRTGQFHAAGPGWITSTRYDTADVSGNIPGASAGRTTNGTWTRSSSGRLIYVRVDYQNEIEGNIDKREAVFQHYVRAVYGPVQSWDESLNPDQQGGLGPQGIVMTCQRLFVTETGQAPQRGMELSAVGNTLVEGAAFTAKAQRLSYIQAKDQLVLDGENGLAQLQQQKRPGERPTEFSARQIKYWVGTGQVEVFGATQLDYTHVGSPDMPKARIR